MKSLMRNKQKPNVSLLLILIFSVNVHLVAQTTISEELTEFKTYPFSDPNPVPEINRMYPYFYFHG